jgi:hypothetical protein
MTSARRPLAIAALIAVLALALSSVAVPQATATSKGADPGGGKAVAHYQGARVIKDPAITRNAPISKQSRIGIPSAEPTVGSTRSGAVFTSAIQSITRVEVVRSTDAGKSWEVVSPKLPNGRNAQLLSVDPYTYVDNPKDRDFSRLFTIDLTVACAYLSYSDDDGENWVTNPLVCGRPVNDHQTLFGGPPVSSATTGYPNILYYCWNDVASSSCQKSIDGGLVWTATGSPAFPGADPAAGGFCGGLHGHGYADSKGNVYIPKGHCGQPWLAISRDEGRTWERHQVADNGAADHEAGVAVDKKGNIYYTYIGKADRLPYLVVSKNGGEKWSKPMMIGAPGVNEANIPSLDVGGVGKVAVAYMGTENSPGQPFPNDKYNNTTWNGYTVVTGNALANNPVFYSGTVNAKRDPINRGRCGPGRCNHVIFDFIDVIIDLEGRVWSAWVDACNAMCVTTGPSNLGNEGIVGRFVGGPNMK